MNFKIITAKNFCHREFEAEDNKARKEYSL